MKKELALAMAIVAVAGTAALVNGPLAAGQGNGQASGQSNCTGDFVLAESEVLAQPRTLEDDDELIGTKTLLAEDLDRRLFLNVTTANDAVDFHVFFQDDGGACQDYANVDGDCEGTIASADDPDTECTLVSPPGGVTRVYFVNYENPQADDVTFETWVEAISM